MTGDSTTTVARLPDGFAVQVDRRVRVLHNGAALLGGSPTRLLRLAPAARAMINGGRLEVRDEASATLARTLLDATVAHPRPVGGPSHRDVTVVIPVRDNLSGVIRLVGSLRGMRVVVVDDGSAVPIRDADVCDPNLGAAACTVQVLRHESSRGPAAARNTGLASCQTSLVAFLDSDVVPQRGWLEALLGHFCDPAVALVAPRIVGLVGNGDGAIARYEAVRSSLDLGGREAPVLPYSTVAYVPSAAIIARRDALSAAGGFDEAMASGEDVDLCWRLIARGARLRYEPISLVAHEHRTRIWQWLGRKAFYGTSAAPLARRHPENTAPLVLSAGASAVWILLATGTRLGAAAAAVALAVTGRRVAGALQPAQTDPRAVVAVVGQGLLAAALQLAAAICRHYWPLSLLAAVLSVRARRVVLTAAVLDALVDWAVHRRRPVVAASSEAGPVIVPDPVTYLALRRLDDIAYGAGVWSGVLRERHWGPLKPQLRR